MLFGLDHLWESSEYVEKYISFFLFGVKKNAFVFVLDK